MARRPNLPQSAPDLVVVVADGSDPEELEQLRVGLKMLSTQYIRGAQSILRIQILLPQVRLNFRQVRYERDNNGIA